ncbi:MAG: Stf0 family sulfotransferase, partial [Pseudomonadota bacterium]
MRPLQSYIICTTPRSGSTFLCGLLEATGRAGHPDSHFHEPSLNGWLRAYDLDRDRFASEDAAFRAVFDRAVTRGTSRKGLFGLRLQRDSFDFFMAVLARLYPGGSCDAERLTAHDPFCSNCCEIEKMQHLFLTCNDTQKFWDNSSRKLNESLPVQKHIIPNVKNVIFGSPTTLDIVNFIVLSGNQYIAYQHFRDAELRVDTFIKLVTKN